MMTHRCEFRVYYEDTDSGGVVYYANYLKFAERGRTELLRSLGFENTSLWSGMGLAFVVRRLEADYLKPARLDNLLIVETTVGAVKNTSVEMKQSVFSGGVPLCFMTVVLACIDRDFKPARFPDNIKTAFKTEGENK